MRKYLVTLGRVLIGVSLSCLLGLSQGKAEFFPTSVELGVSGEQEPLIFQEATATVLTAAAPIDSTPSVDVDIAQLVQRGLTFYQAGQFAQAIALWQQAASVYQNQGDELNQALILSYLSLAHQQLGDWSKATSVIREAIALLHAQSLNLIENFPRITDNSQLITA